jgi:hypothetical protein
VFASPAAHVLESVCHTATRYPAEPFQGERRPRPVPGEAFAPDVVARLDADSGVQVEAVPIEGDADSGLVGRRLLIVGCVSVR